VFPMVFSGGVVTSNDTARPDDRLPRPLLGGTVVCGLALAMAVLLSFETRIGLDLADEGFLWCGVEATSGGGIPIRDFRAYDPFRYYWAIALRPVLGHGLVGLRLAGDAFLLLGLIAAAATWWKARPTQVSVAFVVAALGVWAGPRHKLFDVATPLLFAYLLSRALERRSIRRWGIVGAAAGAAGLVGRNHLLYCALALIGAITAARREWSWRNEVKIVAVAVAGAIGGLAPGILFATLVRGFGEAYLDQLRIMREHGLTNQPLPIPLPSLWPQTSASALGWGMVPLILVVVAALWSAIGVWRRAGSGGATLMATSLTAIPYCHHMLSRADVPHFLQVAPIGFLAASLWVESLWRRGSRVVPVIVTAWMLLALGAIGVPARPVFQYALHRREYVTQSVGPDRLRMPLAQAKGLACIGRSVEGQCSGQNVLALPDLPGLYPVLGRRSPVWESYADWPASGPRQEEMINQITGNNVGCVVLNEDGVAGETRLRFAATHPLVYRFILKNATIVPSECVPRSMKLLVLPH